MKYIGVLLLGFFIGWVFGAEVQTPPVYRRLCITAWNMGFWTDCSLCHQGAGR